MHTAFLQGYHCYYTYPYGNQNENKANQQDKKKQTTRLWQLAISSVNFHG